MFNGYASPYHPARFHAYGPGHPFHPAHPAHRFASPVPTPPPVATPLSLEDEERAAIAHLESVRRRREAAEARVRAEQEVSPPLADDWWYEPEPDLQAAAYRQAYLREVQRERERAIEAELERRRLIALEAERERERERIRRQEAIAFAVEQERRKRAHFAAVAAERQRRQAEFNAALKRRAEAAARATATNAARCAGRCARRYADQARTNHKSEFDQLNAVLGGLFGINLRDDDVEEEQQTTEQPVAPATAAAPAEQIKIPEPTPAPVAEVPASAQKTETAAKSDEKPAAKDQPAFPEQINDLLSTFLGLRVEPTTDKPAAADKPVAETSTKVTNGIPEGLNEILQQFGLEFEPLEPESTQNETAPAASTSESSTPDTAQKPAKKAEEVNPLSAFLQGVGVSDLPPFVRDILENVEAAFKDESKPEPAEESYEGKGKGVAKGEKADKSASAPAPKPTPAPQPAAEQEEQPTSTTSLATLDHIASELDLVRDSFTFPATLSFSHSTDAAPSLLFNKNNRPFHEQSNKLLQLLLQADSVASGGDKDVRRKRKALVRSVEKEIEDLERKRDAVWEEVRERRARGEESDSESESTSSATSVIGDHEHVHDDIAPAPTAPVEVNDHKSYAEAAASARHGETEVVFEAPADVEGFEVSGEETATHETPQAAEQNVEEHKEVEVKPEENPQEEQNEVKNQDKEDEYELL